MVQFRWAVVVVVVVGIVAVVAALKVVVAVVAALKVATEQKVAMWFVKEPNRMAPPVAYGIMSETSLFLLSLVFITTYYI